MSSLSLFEEKQVRRAWDSEQNRWLFAIVDVVTILTDSPNPQVYWRVLKKRLTDEGNETVTNCNGLKTRISDLPNGLIVVLHYLLPDAVNYLWILKDTILKQMCTYLKKSSILLEFSQSDFETCAREQFAALVGKLKTLSFARDRIEYTVIMSNYCEIFLTSNYSMIVLVMIHELIHTYAEDEHYNSAEHFQMNWDFDTDYQLVTLMMARDKRMDVGRLFETKFVNCSGRIYILEWYNTQECRFLRKASVASKVIAA